MRGMLAKGLAVTTSSVLLGGNAENNILAILRACLLFGFRSFGFCAEQRALALFTAEAQ